MTLQTYAPPYLTSLVDARGQTKLKSEYLIRKSQEDLQMTKISQEEIEELMDSEFLKSVAKAREEYATGQVIAADEVLKMFKERI